MLSSASDLQAVRVAADFVASQRTLDRGVAVPVRSGAGNPSFPKVHRLPVGDGYLLLALGLAYAARRNERPRREADPNIDG